jgi:tetratricopeptide (TPR) repeat protein
MGEPHSTGATPAAERDWGQWFKEHARQLAYGAAAAVLVAAAIWVYVVSEARKEQFASQALVDARTSAEAGNLPLAANDLARLMDRYGGTRAADEAVVLLNEIRLVQGQTDIAVKALQSFVQKSHRGYVMASAYALLGGGLENEHKFRDAADAYRHAADAATHDFLRAQYLIDVGRVLAVAGDTAGAQAAYGEVVSKYGELPQAAEARVRLGEVGGATPPAKPGDAATGQSPGG